MSTNHLLLLTNDNGALTLIACPDGDTWHQIAALAVEGDDDVNAWSVPEDAFTDTTKIIEILSAEDGASLNDLLPLSVTAVSLVNLLSGVGLGPVERDRNGNPIGDVLINPAALAPDYEPDEEDEDGLLVCRYCGRGGLQVLEYQGVRYPMKRPEVIADPDSGEPQIWATVDTGFEYRDVDSPFDIRLWCLNGHELESPGWLNRDWQC